MPHVFYTYRSEFSESESRECSPVRKGSIFLTACEMSQRRFASMTATISNYYEAEIMSPIYCQSRAAEKSDTFTPSGGRRLCILIETPEGNGRLLLLDLSNQNTAG